MYFCLYKCDFVYDIVYLCILFFNVFLCSNFIRVKGKIIKREISEFVGFRL